MTHSRRGTTRPVVPVAFVSLLLPLLLSACGVASEPCELDTAYEFGWTGGLAFREDRSRLEPPATYGVTRTFRFQEEDVSCTTTIPACGAADEIDVDEVRDALEHPDVAAAWTTDDPVVHGQDGRPVDAGVWYVRRRPETGPPQTILIGLCSAPECRDVPAGLRALRELLEDLDEQQRSDAACEALRTGG